MPIIVPLDLKASYCCGFPRQKLHASGYFCLRIRGDTPKPPPRRLLFFWRSRLRQTRIKGAARFCGLSDSALLRAVGPVRLRLRLIISDRSRGKSQPLHPAHRAFSQKFAPRALRPRRCMGGKLVIRVTAGELALSRQVRLHGGARLLSSRARLIPKWHRFRTMSRAEPELL